jgi:hypothetical protein
MNATECSLDAPLSPGHPLAIKPREARVTVTRTLRQARWDWGLEPAVGSIVLAAHIAGLDGLGVLDREWDLIGNSCPEAMKATPTGSGAWWVHAGDCHAFVAGPSILDHLMAGIGEGRATVIIEAVTSAGLLEALAFFGPRYGFSLSLAQHRSQTALTALRTGAPARDGALSPLQSEDYIVDATVWRRLLERSSSYLIPETEVSRGHAGDGTRAFPLPAQLASL